MDTTTEPALRIEGGRKTYPSRRHADREAVRDVSLTVATGSVHGLLGPNGAGKTTTLKMLLGLVRPSGGTFEILGEPASPDVRARTGFLPEQPYFAPSLSAQQTLRLFGRICGLGREEIDTRSDSLLARVGLQGREHEPLRKYSRGMLQRLGIAQALMSRPEVVILDEPASGLDPVGQRDVRNLILELRESGTTVLLSSHQLSEVEAVCDEVTILASGQVAAEGRLDDLLNVAGQTSIRVRGSAEGLPPAVAPHATDVAVSGGVSVFSIADERVRVVVDALDDAGWPIISITPKRESLEDYFTRLLERPVEEVAS